MDWGPDGAPARLLPALPGFAGLVWVPLPVRCRIWSCVFVHDGAGGRLDGGVLRLVPAIPAGAVSNPRSRYRPGRLLQFRADLRRGGGDPNGPAAEILRGQLRPGRSHDYAGLC